MNYVIKKVFVKFKKIFSVRTVSLEHQRFWISLIILALKRENVEYHRCNRIEIKNSLTPFTHILSIYYMQSYDIRKTKRLPSCFWCVCPMNSREVTNLEFEIGLVDAGSSAAANALTVSGQQPRFLYTRTRNSEGKTTVVVATSFALHPAVAVARPWSGRQNVIWR